MPGKKRRSDIRDVAREAGVSVATVSHALNNKGRIAAETRERVRRIANELGYRPSVSARNLVSQRNGLIGLVVSANSWETMQRGTLHYFTQLMMSATTEALGAGYALASLPAEKDFGNDIQIDGAIVMDPIESDPILERLRKQNIPYLTTGRDAADENSHNWVDNNHTYGAEMVLNHLYENGARRPVLLSPENAISFTRDVERAFRKWAAEKGLEPLIVHTQEDSMERAGFEVMTELLGSASPPDAMFATYSPLALGAVSAAEAANVRIPEDLMIVTAATDEMPRFQGRGPALTTLELHPDRLGRTAVQMLLSILDGKDNGSPHIIEPDLTIRESTLRT